MTRFARHFAVRAAFTLYASVTQAGPLDGLSKEEPLCFGHHYSKTELGARPKQTVQKFDVKVYVDDNGSPNSPLMKVSAQIRRPKGKVGHYSNLMLCTLASNELQCAIECDGGSAVVSWTAAVDDKSVTFVNNGILLYGGCDDQSVDPIFLTPTAQGDDQFSLTKENCN